MTLTVAQLSESELLARIFPRLHAGTTTLLGPGDDAAIIAAPDARTVISIDTQVQDKDFRLAWPNGTASTGFDVGWKAAAQNLSDINAMGASATAMVVSLTLPGTTPVGWVEDFADGLSAAIVALGAPQCSVAGGDLSGGSEIVVTVAVTGSLEGRDPVLRSGAKVGDQVAVCGNMGFAAAGWALYESSILPSGHTGAMADAATLFARPVPPLAAGPAAAMAGATAMMDISDGLLRDSQRLAAASGVCLDLDSAVLAAQARKLEETAVVLGENPLHWVLTGGEDHSLLSTFPDGYSLPDGFVRIGSVVSMGAPEAAVTVDGQNFEGAASGALGWDHFAV
ncbi:thiamine-monophosphate kinase [Arthrobacter stackebrandtii]|uniref:Thiamine-monophosphate kinase n=1 Tax=Arthrobacter stackebrandtii TaxID=272161 RepID=A0ABS4YZC9_9MICC|nr:thiamine-phosphate kinase [Arthrobacter stackebrandtii]MBP2414081.1 thiamine-monophosphate kinase [Arthrobacter stackebrandtii]PYG99374.1 thiamine-phosphate kinase [Arthrobacter stackebrandtii]